MSFFLAHTVYTCTFIVTHAQYQYFIICRIDLHFYCTVLAFTILQ